MTRRESKNRIVREAKHAVLTEGQHPVESGNAAAKAGKLGATIQSILSDLEPEAVYFTDSNGQRTAFIFSKCRMLLKSRHRRAVIPRVQCKH